MNANNQETDLVLLHQRILADLAVKFPSPWKIACYHREYERLAVPFLNFDLTAMPPSQLGANIGDGQWQADLRFEAYLFTDYKQPDYRIKTRLYGTQLAAFLMGHQWSGVANGPCRVIDSGEDRWHDSGAAQYDCWRVEWEQACIFGADIYAGGVIPSELYLGFPPNVGTGHEADYKRLV